MSNTSLLGAYGALGNSSLLFRNKLVNGNFDIWQRGTSVTKSAPFSGNTFVADRFFAAVDSSATGSYTVSQQAFTPGQSDVPNEPSYFYRFATSSLVNSTNGFSYALQQRVEDVRSLAGQTVTVSFYAKASANTSLSVSLVQAFGSGGSSANIIPAQVVSLTTSWQKITKTFVVPSISGKTIGANSYLALEMFAALRGTTATAYGVSEFTALGTGSYDIAQVQLEAGPVATPFEHRPYGLELSLAQRYYYKVDMSQGTSAKNVSGFCITGQNHATIFVAPPVTMRFNANLSHNLADNQYTATSPIGSQWTFIQDGFSFATKTGTAQFTPNGAGLVIYGASWNVTARPLFGPAVLLAYNAEL